MATMTGSIESTVDLISAGLVERFRQELRERLLHVAIETAEEVALSTARKVVAQVEGIRAFEKNQIELTIMFNGRVFDESTENDPMR